LSQAVQRMFHSFISSSERRPRGRWTLFFLIVFAIIGGAEAALRVASLRMLLPPRSHFYHPAIARRLDALEMLLDRRTRVDVLFIGSSIVLSNVDPLFFDEIAGWHGRQIVSFNAGLAGLWPRGVELYARHLWLPTARPRVVVQGIRYAELAATTDAKNETQIWTGRVEPAWRRTDLRTRVYTMPVSHIYLLQYQGVLTRILQQFRTGWIPPPNPEETDLAYTSRGYRPRDKPRNSSIDTWEVDLPNEGTCNDRPCRIGLDALRRTIRAARMTGSAYILVNVPEHSSRWKTQDGARRYAHYVNTMRIFAAEEGVDFVDPTDGDPYRFEHAAYNDFAHLTADGARLFTRMLADRLVPVIRAAATTQDVPRRKSVRAGFRWAWEKS
jgi:hypothetical protein